VNDPVLFNDVTLVGDEPQLVMQAIASGKISGAGPFTTQAELELERINEAKRVMLTTSCTHALELAARLLYVGPDDEVIVPAYTFVSTASAFALTGARPVFVDVTPGTFNLDVDAVQAAITHRTAAIATIHYAGIAEDIDDLAALADCHGLPLIEDNAHGLGSTFNGQKLGTFGAMSTLSFHETKNITCGEGGALVINDDRFIDRAEVLRETGTNRARFFRGQVDKYTWNDVGSSWIPSEILAAFLVGQLRGFDQVQAHRMSTWLAYDAALHDWAAGIGARTPFVPDACEHSAHMYWLHMADLEQRSRFIEHMREAGVMASFHYQALHTAPAGWKFGGLPGACPVAESASDCLVRLPLHAGVSVSDRDRVIQAALSFTD
jgi:dTDP-4-amino-4,6-dideoxygalactose transaminase